MSLDTLLESHDWGFASSKQTLTLLDDFTADISESGGWNYAYSLPADCAVLREISRDGIFSRVNQYEDYKEKWEEYYSGSGPAIYTDVPDAHGRYTVRVNDDIAFPTHVGRALSAQWAMDCAASLITQNYAKIKDVLIREAKNDISLAIAHDLGRQPSRSDAPVPFIAVRGV